MKTYYAVHKGKNQGIYTSWDQCKKQIENFKEPIFKKFTNEEDAKKFVEIGFGINKKPKIVKRRENDDIKNNLKIEDELEEDGIEKIFIYTDGSLIRINNFVKAGYGIYIPEKNISVSKPLLNQKLTNNRAELTAIIESIKYLDEEDFLKKICIFTDSQYSMYIFNGTGERYEKDNFKNKDKDVPNIDLIKKILELKRTYNIVLLKVRAHTDKKDKHSIANNIADKLAGEGANEKPNTESIFTKEYICSDEVIKDKEDKEENKEGKIESNNNFKTISITAPDKKYKQPKFKNLKLSSFF